MPGQYEGFLYKRPVANSAVVARLKNNSKMLAAHGIIGDRTDFKGQTMLPYRVVTEDPMCDPKETSTTITGNHDQNPSNQRNIKSSLSFS